ncbi:hypothetical protein FVQ98_08405 [Ottowia sp. GY511]|uniref:Transmembrane protein n=1 Tax=Ottowia flava TaxID=2675430 RepID=A0ABW4KSK2_9BURK|nr:hypothetical protein [Ottowia sp. GY511]TXK29534.1 hypothetical protein FVQ98_08405 [Ottowia sp. GY511]
MNRIPIPLIATLAGVALYALAVFWTSRHPSPLTLALAALPFVWFALAYAKGGARAGLPTAVRIGRLLPLIATLLALGLAWRPLLSNVRLLYLAQHIGVHAILCWLFARTLRHGCTPLCTEFASWVHEDMSSTRLLWYTRQVTFWWAMFFGLMVIASLLLFRYASPEAWTGFSAVIGPLLTGAVFLIENLLRSRFLPPQDRVGLTGTWRAIQARLRHQSRAPQRAP